jgi:hypothetical protein
MPLAVEQCFHTTRIHGNVCTILFLLVDTFLVFAHNSLKSGRQLLAAFQKSFAKIRKMYQPIVRKGIKFI